MKGKNVFSSKVGVYRLECFGNYDARDSICFKWCQLNIRCSIARGEHEDVEVLEDIFCCGRELIRVQ